MASGGVVPAVSNIRVQGADPLSTEGYKVGPPGSIIFQARPTDAQSDLDPSSRCAGALEGGLRDNVCVT